MDQRPPDLDLLNATHRFPGPYTYKIFGPPHAAFEQAVRHAAQTVLGAGVDYDLTRRASRSGKHVCLSLEIHAHSAEQVASLYARLRRLDELVMLI